MTPSRTTTWEPIHTSSPTVIPRLVTGCRWTGRPGAKPAGDVGLGRDVRAVAQVQDVRVHRGALRDEAVLAQTHLPGPREQPLLPLLLGSPLPVRGLSGEAPRAVLEEAVVV
ncbi:hypothetical protein [Streptomyces paradoxus]|uniref:Uncharacterized protein n=1 Tax=Streptomyces paradoxus TaxID=66375 RepID=A0A7W9TGB4_9ACTN|nr:hypothetical protein [Streptomyces paradoxus]MBB6080154.1 hypothetical protein [Streptomyces paradoxus]